jgi:hypothetical protein
LKNIATTPPPHPVDYKKGDVIRLSLFDIEGQYKI